MRPGRETGFSPARARVEPGRRRGIRSRGTCAVLQPPLSRPRRPRHGRTPDPQQRRFRSRLVVLFDQYVHCDIDRRGCAGGEPGLRTRPEGATRGRPAQDRVGADRRSWLHTLSLRPVARLGLSARRGLRVSCGPSNGPRAGQSPRRHGQRQAVARRHHAHGRLAKQSEGPRDADHRRRFGRRGAWSPRGNRARAGVQPRPADEFRTPGSPVAPGHQCCR